MNRLLALALAAALIAPASAIARDGLLCHITDSQGSDLTYAFGQNTATTMVETGFRKNGVGVFSDVGQRPVWTGTFTPDTITLHSVEAPGWQIYMGPNAEAVLSHNGRWAGSGNLPCEQSGQRRHWRRGP
jgi:hypothetical protein